MFSEDRNEDVLKKASIDLELPSSRRLKYRRYKVKGRTLNR